jgi:large exoprotein involved in heme utilization and adhesion
LAKGGSQFLLTERGGLPPTLAEATRSDTTLVDLGTPGQIVENSASDAIQTTSSTTLVEAQGWMLGSKGEVILTTFAVNITPDIPWLIPTSCNAT